MNTTDRARKKKRHAQMASYGQRHHPELSEHGDRRRRRPGARRRYSEDDGADSERLLGKGWMRSVKVARLSIEDERALAERIKTGDADAQTQLIVANLPLVFRAVRMYRKSGVPLDDLIQEGNLGLTRAARSFDPSIHTASFATYANYWIRFDLVCLVANHASLIPLSRHAMRMHLRYLRALKELKSKRPAGGADGGSKTLSLSEIAAHMGVSTLRLKRAMVHTTDQGSLLTLGEIPAEERVQPEEVVASEEQRALVHATLQRLCPFEAWLLSMRYGVDMLRPFPWVRGTRRRRSSAAHGSGGESAEAAAPAAVRNSQRSAAKFHRTFAEIAAECGLSLHRVRLFHNAALNRLRAALDPQLADEN